MNFSIIQEHAGKIAAALSFIYRILYGLVSYLWLALQLFWEEYGEDILAGFVKLVFYVVDTAGEVYLSGQATRRFFDNRLKEKLSSAFFPLVDVH